MAWLDVRGSRTLMTLTALALLSLLSVTASAADVDSIQFQARVLWIAGETMVVATDNSQSINVDLRQVSQDEYQRLERNDLVIVTGIIPAENNRVVATSIEPVEP
jgi:type 1 fimbria pilin